VWPAKRPTIRLRGDTLDAPLVDDQSTRVDQELVAYFDRRFADLKSELTSELKSELKSELMSELVPGIRAEIASSASALASELRAEIATSAAETRRHFDVVADRLMDKIQLVGEGVIGVDQKLDRFRGEVADEFHRVDRRLLRLEARIIG